MNTCNNNTCKSAFFILRKVSRIRRYITTEAAKTLIHSLISSKIDYCNGLLFGLLKCNLDRLQRALNCAARVITGTKKHDPITQVLIDLHWLPIKYRIDYKIALLTFKSLHNLGPSYLANLVEKYVPPRALRSADNNVLVLPKTKLKTCGDRSFTFTFTSSYPMEFFAIFFEAWIRFGHF